MDKYKKLATNTLVLGIGQFSSKVLSFILIFLYSNIGWFKGGDFTVATNLANMANLLMAIFSISIGDAVMRFALEKKYNAKQVFSIGLIVSFVGFIAMLPFVPFVEGFFNFVYQNQDGAVANQRSADGWIIYAYMVASTLRTVCALFVRSRVSVKLYAVDGIITTFTLLMYGALLMGVFKLGSIGFVLATVLSDFTSVVFLFYMAKLHKQIRLFGIDKPLRRAMIRYALPLAPSNISWLAAQASNGLILASYLTLAESDFYAAATKLPGVIVIISGIVSQAWQMSAVTERNSRTIANFYTNVFNIYQSVIYVTIATMLLFNEQLTRLMGANLVDTYKYSPFLLIGVMFSCFSTFLNTIYLADKRTGRSFATTFLGAAINIILGFALIPWMGIYGATIANMLNFGVTFVVRAVDTRKIVYINYNWVKLVLNIGLLFVMALLTIFKNDYTPFGLVIAFFIVAIINFRTTVIALRRIIRRR